MFFPDYKETGLVYHVCHITDLNSIMENGIKYNDKNTYIYKYLDFHRFIDSFKPLSIPKWVRREKAIFASINYDKNHKWHSHSAILGLKINIDKCWIANENLANHVYEPFILKDVKNFQMAQSYIEKKGKEIIKKYWETSLSFRDNLKYKRSTEKRYDAEVLVFHDIRPKDIKLMAITSDHRIMSARDWKNYFSIK